MEQIKRFLRDKGFALALVACLAAAAAAGVWAVRTVRDELKNSLEELETPQTGQEEILPGIDETLDETLNGSWNEQEDEAWQQPDTNVANSMTEVPKPAPSAPHTDAAPSSGASSGSGFVHEPSALRTDSGSGSDSPAPASTQPVAGRILNAYSGDELVYNKTLGDWRTHNGVDYACEQGAQVSAPAAGEVTEVGTDGRWGGIVCIKDSEGRLWRLCGVSGASVEQGETVTVGQQLGKAGSISCECAEESHVHLEVRQDDGYLDPAKLLN